MANPIDPHPLSYSTTTLTHRLLAFNRISASTAAHSDVRRGRRRRAKENKGGARRRRGGGARARAVI